MTLIGFVWALFAPALLIPLIWGTDQLLKRLSVPVRHNRLRWLPMRPLMAAAAVLMPVLGMYVSDRAEFQKICDANSAIVTVRREGLDPVEGIFLNDSTANSFGTRYIEEEGFKWMEARSIYNRDAYTLYEKQSDGSIKLTETSELTAMYEVTSETSSVARHTSISKIVVKERETGKVLGSAASTRFDGGRAKLVLGAWGSVSCPNPSSSEGHQAFLAYYHLAKNVLRPGR